MARVYIADFEADGFLEEATTLWCGVLKNVETGTIFSFSPSSDGDYINRLLSFLDNHTDVLICHNGIGYDFPLLRRLYGYEYRGKKVDTLLMSRLQNPDRRSPAGCPNRHAPHSVEAWGYRFGRYKPEHEDWSKFSEEMLHRCTEDVEIQHLIYKELLKEARGLNWRDGQVLTFQLFDLLQRSEEYGWHVDQEHMHKSVYFLDRWIGLIDRAVIPYLPVSVDVEEVKKDGEYKYLSRPFKKDGTHSEAVLGWANKSGTEPLLEYIAGPFSRVSFRATNLNSNHEVKQFLLKEGWEPEEWNTNDDGERTSPKLSKTDPFVGVNKGVGKLVAKRVQCRHRRSSILGFFQLIRPDGRIASVVSGLTTTGRAKHKNIVNIPRVGSFFGKWMRKIFIAKPGWVLVGTDSDANHARQLAARMGDDEFIYAVTKGDKKEGTDMHSVNKKKIGSVCKTRDQAKIFFYAFLLGAMGKRLSQVLECTVKEAEAARESFLENLPGLKKVIDDLVSEWQDHATPVYNKKYNRTEYQNGWFTGLDGRPVYCKFQKDVLGYALQTDESIQMARAYVQFHIWMSKTKYKWGEDWGTVCWYHDEFTIECRPEIAKKLGKLAARSIEWAGEYYGIKCPHKGNAQIEKDWASIH